MDYEIVFIVILIAIIAFLVLYKKKDRAPSVEPVSKPAEPNPVDDLLRLNLDVRKSFMASNLVVITEEIIDLLVDLMPLVKEQESASGELLWTVNRIATEYLPNKCVYPFIRLDEQHQGDSSLVSSFEDSIGALKAELVSVKAMVVGRDVKQFNAKAKFLKNRFDNTGA
jgi:hypothetical protein